MGNRDGGNSGRSSLSPLQLHQCVSLSNFSSSSSTRGACVRLHLVGMSQLSQVRPKPPRWKSQIWAGAAEIRSCRPMGAHCALVVLPAFHKHREPRLNTPLYLRQSIGIKDTLKGVPGDRKSGNLNILSLTINGNEYENEKIFTILT